MSGLDARWLANSLRCCRWAASCSGAWVGDVQALVGCGERCGLLMRRIKVVQVLHVRPFNPVKNRENIVSDSKALVGWGLAEIGT